MVKNKRVVSETILVEGEPASRFIGAPSRLPLDAMEWRKGFALFGMRIYHRPLFSPLLIQAPVEPLSTFSTGFWRLRWTRWGRKLG